MYTYPGRRRTFTLTLIVEYRTYANMRDKFISELESLQIAQKSQRDYGCMGYDYFLSISDENVVLLIEKWSSQETWKKHTLTPHLEALAKIKSDFVQRTTVTKFCSDV